MPRGAGSPAGGLQPAGQNAPAAISESWKGIVVERGLVR